MEYYTNRYPWFLPIPSIHKIPILIKLVPSNYSTFKMYRSVSGVSFTGMSVRKSDI